MVKFEFAESLIPHVNMGMLKLNLQDRVRRIDIINNKVTPSERMTVLQIVTKAIITEELTSRLLFEIQDHLPEDTSVELVLLAEPIGKSANGSVTIRFRKNLKRAA